MDTINDVCTIEGVLVYDQWQCYMQFNEYDVIAHTGLFAGYYTV